MADNVTITSGANSTPPANTKISTDEDATNGHVQRVKLAVSANGSSTHIGGDASGLQVQGAAAENAAAAGNPVLSAGRYDATPRTLGDGDAGAIALDADGAVQISDGGNTITVDGTVTAQPLSAILEGGLTELVGINEQVDQNEYSASVGVALGGTYSGEILSFALYATEDGTGAVQDSDGWLLVLDADPATTAGDTALTAAEWVTVLGRARVTPADWITDANGGVAYIYDTPIPFHALATLYFVWLHKDATSLNDGAGDDEQLEFNFWYRRES